MKPFLAGASRDFLTQWAVERGFPKFRGNQLAQWVYDRGVIDPDGMNNLPKDLRTAVKEDFFAPGGRIIERTESGRDVTKLGFALEDGEVIEMALIPAAERLTFCLSTQVGCPVGCIFCASGANGLTRNLQSGEMLEEFLFCCAEAGRKCDNIVFMGIGEGLLNFEALARTLEVLTSPDGYGLSPRRITVSTSGFVPGMLKFAELKREFNLAVSLHAPDDAIRAKLIPDKLRYPIAEVLAAADRIREGSGRQYTLEYTMVAGINDSGDAASALAALARKHRAKINLIPCNAVDGSCKRPSAEQIRRFEEILEQGGAHFTRRVERGRGGKAACGQLRAAHLKKNVSQEGDDTP